MGCQPWWPLNPEMLQRVWQISCGADWTCHTASIASGREFSQSFTKFRGFRVMTSNQVAVGAAADEIVGLSQALTRVLEQACAVATSDATVLILGESGVGKE